MLTDANEAMARATTPRLTSSQCEIQLSSGLKPLFSVAIAFSVSNPERRLMSGHLVSRESGPVSYVVSHVVGRARCPYLGVPDRHGEH